MKRIIIGVFICAVAVPLAAQSNIQQQVEVTREYRPGLDQAAKIDVAPRMSDTISLRPEVEYSIIPTPWKTVFDIKPISPIKISTADYTPQWPFYVRAGGGWPGMTLLDVYATTKNDKGYAGAYINHYGEYAKIENDLAVKHPSMRMRNIVGGFLGRDSGRRNLTAELRYDNRIVQPYGDFELAEAGFLSSYYPGSHKVMYHNITAGVAYGDLFKDFSRFNWRVGISAGYFADNASSGQGSFGLDGGIGLGVGSGELVLGIRGTYEVGMDALSDYSDAQVTLMPKYSLVADDLNLVLGLDLVYDYYDGTTAKFNLFPQIELSYDVGEAFTAYLKADGGMTDGSFRALSYENPYVVAAKWLRNSSRTGARLGIFGAVVPYFSFDVYGGCDMYKDFHYFANLYEEGNTTRFMPLGDVDATIFYGAADLRASIARGLGIELSARFNAVPDVESPVAEMGKPGLGIATYEADATIRYAYREKVFLSAGFGFTGPREVSVVEFRNVAGAERPIFYTGKLKATVNLRADLEVKVNRKANVFVSAENLLNQKIYRFNHYPTMGTSVVAGVKMVF